MDQDQWETGRLLQQARQQLRMPIAHVAHLADVSEGWVRQIEAGWKRQAGKIIPVAPTPRNVARIALAVGLDPHEVLATAGLTIDDDVLARETAQAWLTQVPDDRMPLAVTLLQGLAES